MTTKKKLLNKISELEYKQKLMEKKIGFLLKKDDKKAVLFIDQDIIRWQNIVQVYYMRYGEINCTDIVAPCENAKIVFEDADTVVVCLTNSTDKKTYKLIDKLTCRAVTAPADFSLEKEEKEEKEGEKAND